MCKHLDRLVKQFLESFLREQIVGSEPEDCYGNRKKL